MTARTTLSTILFIALSAVAGCAGEAPGGGTGTNPGGGRWKLTLEQAIQGIESGKWTFYVNVNLDVVILAGE